MLNSNSENERRTGSERRLATNSQTPPTGNGAVVLDAVLAHLGNMVSIRALSFLGFTPLKEDLIARAEAGTKKYGTPLRLNNGRRAIVDLYQEIQDALMYAMQARLEGDKQGGAHVESLAVIAANIALILDTRG